MSYILDFIGWVVLLGFLWFFVVCYIATLKLENGTKTMVDIFYKPFI